MPAKDLIHDAVREALENDGWQITHEPYTIEYETIKLSADLAAEPLLAAEREGKKIVIEIKSFVGRSPVQDLKLALGQYNLYVVYLEILAPERQLYLAVSRRTYQEFFEQPAIQIALQRYNVKVLVVDVEKKEIVQWIN
ncbi:MAG: XisH family protein [Caldilineaceae bacterium]